MYFVNMGIKLLLMLVRGSSFLISSTWPLKIGWEFLIWGGGGEGIGLNLFSFGSQEKTARSISKHVTQIDIIIYYTLLKSLHPSIPTV